MGCTETKHIAVEQLKKSGPGSPLKRKGSIVGSNTPSKQPQNTPSKIKSKSSVSLDKRVERLSQSTKLSVSQIMEENPEPVKHKQKIKSVRKLPAAMERSNLEDIQELKSSGRYDKEAHMERSQLHRLIRVYDLG